jgi:hypothetical protein
MFALIVLAFVFLLLTAAPSYAYIDAGVGSMILQTIAGSVIAAALFWRRLVLRIKGWFGSSPPQDRDRDRGADVKNR